MNLLSRTGRLTRNLALPLPLVPGGHKSSSPLQWCAWPYTITCRHTHGVSSVPSLSLPSGHTPAGLAQTSQPTNYIHTTPRPAELETAARGAVPARSGAPARCQRAHTSPHLPAIHELRIGSSRHRESRVYAEGNHSSNALAKCLHYMRDGPPIKCFCDACCESDSGRSHFYKPGPASLGRTGYTGQSFWARWTVLRRGRWLVVAWR